MSNRICAIDIGSDLLSAVILQSDGRKKPIIVKTVFEIVDSRPIEDIFSHLIESIGYSFETCHVSFGADFFHYRNLTLPFNDRKTIDKVLPYELEELVSEGSDEIVVDSIINKGNNGKGEVLAAFLSKKFIASWLDTMQSVGVDPETITVSCLAGATRLLKTNTIPADFFYLYVGLQRATLIQVESGAIHFIRSLIFDPGLEVGYQFDKDTNKVIPLRTQNVAHAFENFCNELQQTIFAIGGSAKVPVYVTDVLGDMANLVGMLNSQTELSCKIPDRDDFTFEQELNGTVMGGSFSGLFANAIDLALQASKGFHLMNYRKDGFAIKRSFAKNQAMARAVAVTLLAMTVGVFSYLFYDYTKIVAEKETVTKEIQAVFTATLPDITRIVDPIQQMQVAVNALKASTIEGGGRNSSYKVLDILVEVSTLIPKSLDVELKSMIIDDKGVRLMGFTDNFNTVDAIKKALDQSVIFMEVDINSANLDQKSSKIKFELKLSMGGL